MSEHDDGVLHHLISKVFLKGDKKATGLSYTDIVDTTYAPFPQSDSDVARNEYYCIFYVYRLGLFLLSKSASDSAMSLRNGYRTRCRYR